MGDPNMPDEFRDVVAGSPLSVYLSPKPVTTPAPVTGPLPPTAPVQINPIMGDLPSTLPPLSYSGGTAPHAPTIATVKPPMPTQAEWNVQASLMKLEKMIGIIGAAVARLTQNLNSW
jgi:hypothetical protein